MYQNFFSVLELLKLQLRDGKKYSIILSANETAECKQLKKTIKKQLTSYTFNDGKIIPIQAEMGQT